jgi:hypothetical protein
MEMRTSARQAGAVHAQKEQLMIYNALPNGQRSSLAAG